jgi:polyisoprenoid-binding protein YceI
MPSRRTARAIAATEENRNRPLMVATGALAAIALIWALLATAAQAETPQGGTYVIDDTHVHASFKVSHVGFSSTIGNFDTVSGDIVINADDLTASTVNVTIDTASIDTAHKERDEHLRNADFFNVAEYPEMTFTSTAIEVTGDNTAKVTGDLTMLGETHPVTLDVTLNKAAEHPFSKKYVAGFSATGTLDRTQWGMDYGVPAVGSEIELLIEAEAMRQE